MPEPPVMQRIGVLYMNLTISGHHLELTPAIREYVQSKLERVTRHFDHVIDISVKLSVDSLPGKDLHVESEAQDLYAAIDTLIDKLDRQVLKHKDKIQNHQHDGIKNYAHQDTEAA